MSQKRHTTAEIAKKAGVSPATVSRVIHHRELVRSGTVLLVEEAMKKLGVKIPTPPEKKMNQKEVILVNCPAGTNPFYEDVISGVITSANAHGYYTILNYSPINRGTIEDFLQLIKKVHASGVITLGLLSTEILDAVAQEVPLVQCCEYNKNANYPYVSIDDVAAAKKATKYLIGCGRNKIAFLNGPRQYKYAQDRLIGFRQAMNEAKLFVPNSWIIHVPEINYDMAYTIVSQLLTISERPNAIFAASDVLAAAVINAARNHQTLIPEDLMVVGFDNIDYCQITRPTITSVNQPKSQMGFTACEILVENIINSGLSQRTMILSTEMIIRESTDGRQG